MGKGNRLIKTIAFAAALAMCRSAVYPATALPQYVPYEEDEFPVWLRKVRRAEVITLGATAITYPLVGLFTSLDDSKMEDFWIKFGISAAAGAVIALADFIIGEIGAKPASAGAKPVVVELDPGSAEAVDLEALRRAAEDRNMAVPGSGEHIHGSAASDNSTRSFGPEASGSAGAPDSARMSGSGEANGASEALI